MSIHSDGAVYQFIGNVTKSTYTDIADLPAGAVALQNADTGALYYNSDSAIAAGATTPIRVVQRRANGELLYSPVFPFNRILSGTKQQKTPVLDKEQVTYVGTNAAGTATSGLGTITVNNTYIIDIEMTHSSLNLNNTPLIKTIPYMVTSGGTVRTLVTGLCENSIRILNRDRKPDSPMFRVERICDASSVAALATATVAKLTKDSKTVYVYTKTADGTADFTASTTSIAAADVINIPTMNGKVFTFTANILGSGAGHHAVYIGGTSYLVADAGTAAQNATAIVTAINAGTQATASDNGAGVVTITYKNGQSYLPPVVWYSADDSTWATLAVTIVTTTYGEAMPVKYIVPTATTAAATFDLDIAWQGETGYVIDGTTAATNIGVSTLPGTELWGLKYTGLPLPFDSYDQLVGRYDKVRFVVKPRSNLYPLYNQSGSLITTDVLFDSTVIAVDILKAKEGSGTYPQIAEQEAFVQWQNQYAVLQGPYPPTKYIQEANSAKVYTITSFRVELQGSNNVTTGINPKSYIDINIAIDNTLTTYDNATIATILTNA